MGDHLSNKVQHISIGFRLIVTFPQHFGSRILFVLGKVLFLKDVAGLRFLVEVCRPITLTTYQNGPFQGTHAPSVASIRSLL